MYNFNYKDQHSQISGDRFAYLVSGAENSIETTYTPETLFHMRFNFLIQKIRTYFASVPPV